jgi:endonuclease/exonuclease/phosphatase family metal-dependent hydrolase
VKALLLLALVGCVELEPDTGAWVPAAAITGPLAPELGPPPAPREPTATLRIASWNVHYGDNPDELVASITSDETLRDLDVLLVQEVDAHPDEAQTRAAVLAERLGMTWVYAPAREQNHGGTHGLAILSRYPLENARVRDLPFFQQPIRSRQRIAMAVDVVIGDERLTVVNLHLDVRLGPVDRIRQLAPAVETISGRLVVGGDLNSNPWAWLEATVPLLGTEAIVGQDQAVLIDDYLATLGYAIAIPASAATATTSLASIRLDGLYAREVAVSAGEVIRVTGSDHYPITMDVMLPD